MADDIGKLKVGSFCWVLIALDPDTDEAWENQVMPARFAGVDKSTGRPLWNFLNQEGASDWDTRWIGSEIVAPVL